MHVSFASTARAGEFHGDNRRVIKILHPGRRGTAVTLAKSARVGGALGSQGPPQALQ